MQYFVQANLFRLLKLKILYKILIFQELECAKIIRIQFQSHFTTNRDTIFIFVQIK